MECVDEVDDTEDEGGVGRSSAHIEGNSRRLEVGGSGGRREEVVKHEMAAALVGNSRRERVNSGKEGEGGKKGARRTEEKVGVPHALPLADGVRRRLVRADLEVGLHAEHRAVVW